MAENTELQGLKHKLIRAANTILSAPMDFSGLQGAEAIFKSKFGDAIFTTFRTRSRRNSSSFGQTLPPVRLKYLYMMHYTTTIVSEN